MIDFRYHLVSIVAIFLALTVGIVLGSTVLEPAFYKSAEETTSSLQQANEKHLADISELQTRENGNDSLVTAHLSDLVRGVLPGERVVLVETPGASASLRDPIESLVTDAGAIYAGRISLTDKFVAADQEAIVDGLANSLAPVGTKFPDEATPYDKAATVLGGAIVTNDRTMAGRDNPAAMGVLDAFQAAGLVNMNGTPGQRSTMAIVLAPAQAYEDENAAKATAAVVSVAAGLDTLDLGTVLAGTTVASGAGGAIAALHDTGEAASNVSTVDTVDMAAGRAVVVYALREQLTGRAGAYGVGSGSTSFEPEVAPSPTQAARG